MQLIHISVVSITLVWTWFRLGICVVPYKQPRRHNVPGNLFVDESCIDCDVCRWMCPDVFARKGLMSAVSKQPTNEREKLQAYSAMIACPVGAIRLRQPDELVKKALDVFPAQIDSVRLPGVYHLGYHSKESYGATSYLIKSSNQTIMVDVPRYNSRLADIIQDEFGSIDLCILTHKDDVAHHEKWKERFPTMQRVVHRLDVMHDTKSCEIKLQGSGPWTPVEDVTILHTPGHTAGSICIMFQSKKEAALFSGDHIAYSSSRKALHGFKRYNHGNVDVQQESLYALSSDDLPYQWILPGHGRIVRFSDLQEKRDSVIKAAKEFASDNAWEGLGQNYE